jgi:hypothetical protein
LVGFELFIDLNHLVDLDEEVNNLALLFELLFEATIPLIFDRLLQLGQSRILQLADSGQELLLKLLLVILDSQ